MCKLQHGDKIWENLSPQQRERVDALVAALTALRDIVIEREQGNHDLDEELDQASAALELAEERNA